MFVTVRYGANCQVMVNLQCCVLVLTTHLKRKCQCRPEGSCWPHRGTLGFLHHMSLPPDCIDLLDETGTLMNLSKVENPASEYTSKYLREREHYILIRVIRDKNSEATSYESLLEDLGKHYPDLTDRLQQLSAKTQRRDQWRKGSLQRRAQPHTGTQLKNRTTSKKKRGSEFKKIPK
ncbi:uncharacterized protein C22orf15 homolog isoform X1 [Empidonax traillii]|uniref:uncharacterized protein C22orf15 homolog isoform X1 n=1 Tax=Empidonax traillii TaxID=164674 RepID=UPI000FFD19D7|nr:uncharacterized protein C22orf15 homolog isoform X1 [Empidonax traillii]